MTRIPLDVDEPFEEGSPTAREEKERREERHRARGTSADLDVEKEVTKRHLIEAITSVVVIILYMAFTLLRERDPGVVVLDEDEGPEEDWKEA
jgi:hypothetical protein